MMALAARNDFRAAFNICRTAHQGAFDGREQRLLERLSPHLCRSIALGFRIDGYLAMRNAAFDVLERLADGVVVLDRRARTVGGRPVGAGSRPLGADRLRGRLLLAGPLRARRRAKGQSPVGVCP